MGREQTEHHVGVQKVRTRSRCDLVTVEPRGIRAGVKDDDLDILSSSTKPRRIGWMMSGTDPGLSESPEILKRSESSTSVSPSIITWLEIFVPVSLVTLGSKHASSNTNGTISFSLKPLAENH